jgi:hypothetical protein
MYTMSAHREAGAFLGYQGRLEKRNEMKVGNSYVAGIGVRKILI